MGYWATWKTKQVVFFLKKNGFVRDRQNGSHAIFVKDEYTVVVPIHGGKDMAEGTLKSIIKQSGVPKTEWKK